MIEAKIFLFLFVWPAGQAEDKPLWSSDAYLTIESCEESAVKLKAEIAAEYATYVRTEHHCVHADDRVGK
ncbi:hypothetical protein [Parasphingorhabdus sp.]|uniref:hypothetical protein n=1 Tax=Parasphingorhabdus sp. TaxID=2709688 RepID=UPI00359484DC